MEELESDEEEVEEEKYEYHQNIDDNSEEEEERVIICGRCKTSKRVVVHINGYLCENCGYEGEE